MFDSDSAFVAPSRPYDPGFEPGRSSVGSYVRAIRQHPLLIAAVVLAALVASLLYTAVRSSQYHATAQILVTPVPTGSTYPTGLSVLRDSADPTMTIETAAALVRSQDAAALAASRLGHGWTANKLLSAVSVAPQGGTDVLDVTATAGSSAAATRIANTFAAASVDAQTTALHRQIDAAIASLSAQRAALGTHGGSTAAGLSSTISALEAERGLPNPSLSLSQLATAATAAGSSAGLVIGLALLCGLLVGLAAAVLVEAASNSVRDEEELASLYPAPVLARVRSLGAGTTGSIASVALSPLSGARDRAAGRDGMGRDDARTGAGRRPTDSRGAPADSGNGNPPWLMPAPVAEAFRSLLFQIRRKGADSQVVMVTSASAGEGKTASAVNLAAAAAAAGRSVLLLDLDLRRSGVASRVGVGSHHAIEDLNAADLRLEALVEGVPGLPTLGVLATDAVPADLAHLGMLERFADKLPELIVQARDQYDLVVIDSPPLNEVGDALRLLPVVDDILLVANIGHTPRSALRAARDVLDRAGRHATGVVLVGAGPVAEARHPAPARSSNGKPSERNAPPRQRVLQG